MRSPPSPTPLPTATVTMHLAYTYDNADRRTGLTLPERITGTTWISGTTSLFTQTVTLDAAGQRTNSNDSWGSTSYGYDTAGRLTSASYPDGSTEADQYDASGNRTVITGTTTLGGTNVITNTYDLADEQTRAASTVGNTTFSYDGNGNQTGSYGITGIVTNTYNDLEQLTQVQGPGTNVSYVYDGQGDRLRSYEQGTSTWTLHNDVQDLAGGLSDLVSDGTADYTYLDPGSGEAPVAAYNQTSTHTAYLGSDVLGSVRLATDPTGAVIGAGAYDAWGVSHPNLGTSGATRLAGLQAGSPFGYAGQHYDVGAGTYDLRARIYDPATGTFLRADPHPPSPRQPITLNKYQYALDQPTDFTDPSGQYVPWGSDCDRGGYRLEGKGGVLFGHDLAESAYLLMQQEKGNYDAACEFDIPFGSRSGAAPPDQETLPFPDYSFLPKTGHADIVDNYKGGGAALWEFEPFESQDAFKARDEARHYVAAASNFRRCVTDPSTSFRRFGPRTDSIEWSGPISFHVGDPTAFPNTYVPDRPPAVGSDGHLYDVAIGAWKHVYGGLWFQTFRSKELKDEEKKEEPQPSYAMLTDPNGDWVQLSVGTNPGLADRGVPGGFVVWLPGIRTPTSGCGVLGCAWSLLARGGNSAKNGLLWVGTHPVLLPVGGVAITAIGACATGGCVAAVDTTVGSIVSFIGSAVLSSDTGVAAPNKVALVRSPA